MSTRKMLAALALACGAGTMVNLALTGSVLFGLWVASPLLVFGGIQFDRARKPESASAPRRAGLVAAALALVFVIVSSQAIVMTNKGSTAALLYLFAPLYAAVLGVVFWLLVWGVARLATGSESSAASP
jgi:hypothetical protein